MFMYRFFSCSGKTVCNTSFEKPVTIAQKNCFSKNNKNTSNRPQGCISRFCCDLAASGNRKKSSSHLPIFTQSAFTLIELLVSTACKIGVLPLYSLKKMSMSSLSENFTDLYTLKFFKKQRQGSKDFSAGKNFDPILKFLRESGGVRGGGREAFFKKIPSASLKTAHFTLIELLVSATC